MHKNNLKHSIRPNSRGLLSTSGYAVIAGYLTIALTLGASGCSDTPIQTVANNPDAQQAAMVSSLPVAEAKKPPQIVHQEPIESLLAQLKDNDSCPNQLSNLRFALENELFHREDFYTYRTASRFFGKWYKLQNSLGPIPEGKTDTLIPHDFDAISKNGRGRSRDKAIYPKRSCFFAVSFEIPGVPPKRKPTNQFVSLTAAPEAPLAEDDLPNPDNNPKFYEFVDAFQSMDLISVSACGRAIFNHATDYYPHTRTELRVYQQNMPQHPFGDCNLRYQFNTPHYRVTLELITYRDGSIHRLFIYSILKEN